jgi:hypothetical protein
LFGNQGDGRGVLVKGVVDSKGSTPSIRAAFDGIVVGGSGWAKAISIWAALMSFPKDRCEYTDAESGTDIR